jgi:hypothetical protein
VLSRAVASREHGFDGLYLDDLDLGRSSDFARGALGALVGEVAAAAPDLLLITQNHATVAGNVAIDGYGYDRPLLRATSGATSISSGYRS